jgi:hypothetical protein
LRIQTAEDGTSFQWNDGNWSDFKAAVSARFRQKYTIEPSEISFLTYRYNGLQVDGEGHLNAPVEASEASFSSFRFPETKSAHLKLSLPLSEYNL